MQTTFSPLSFGKSVMKIIQPFPRTVVSYFLEDGNNKNKKQKKTKKNICKTYTLLPHRRLRKSEIHGHYTELYESVIQVYMLLLLLLPPLLLSLILPLRPAFLANASRFSVKPSPADSLVKPPKN